MKMAAVLGRAGQWRNNEKMMFFFGFVGFAEYIYSQWWRDTREGASLKTF